MSYLGHALVENRNGLIAAAMVTHADGYAERDAALLMLAEKQRWRFMIRLTRRFRIAHNPPTTAIRSAPGMNR